MNQRRHLPLYACFGGRASKLVRAAYSQFGGAPLPAAELNPTKCEG